MNLSALLAAVAISAASGSAPIKLAAPGLTYVGIDEKTGDFFVDFLAQQMRTQGVPVTTQSQVSAIIGLERQKTLLGCGETSQTCLAELAGALGVDGVITGSLAKTAKGSWVINLNVVAATDGRTVAAASTRAKDDDELLDWITEAARELSPRILTALGRGTASKDKEVAVNVPTPPKQPDKPLTMPPPPPTKTTDKPADAPKQPTVASATPAPKLTPRTQNTGAVKVGAKGLSEGTSVLGTTKWLVAGAGAAGLITSGVLYGVAFSTRSQLDSGALQVGSRAELNQKLADVAAFQTAAVAAGLIGGLALGGGAALFVLDRPAVKVAISGAVGPAGASAMLSWELP